jgi:flagellar hook-associated protein 1 FlgK
LTVTLPRYQKQLDTVAQQLATQVNDAHVQGYDKDGIIGGPMFDDGSGTLPVDPALITAANLTLRITDTQKLAAASIAPVAGAVSSDGGNATKLAAMAKTDTGVAVSYRKLIVGLGVEAAVATSNLQTQTVVAAQVDASRESVSGVNLDEEMTNMLQFQHAYSAAARMITTIDETLDVLINRTGRVGL